MLYLKPVTIKTWKLTKQILRDAISTGDLKLSNKSIGSTNWKKKPKHVPVSFHDVNENQVHGTCYKNKHIYKSREMPIQSF